MSVATTFLHGMLAGEVRPSTRRSFFSRLGQSFENSRRRQVDREVERLIAIQGGRLTDSLERTIERRFV